MAVSGVSSSNNLSQILNALQDVSGGEKSGGAGGGGDLSVDLKQLMDLIKQLEGGVSKKAAPTHVGW